MLDKTVIFLRDLLNKDFLGGLEGASEPPVRFPTYDQTGAIKFPTDAVSIMLINMERETVLRPAEPYVRVLDNGSEQTINPDIRLILYLMFVASYAHYETGLGALSRVVAFFQRNRIFTHETYSELNADLDKLIVELITLPLKDSHDLWSALRAAYQPSVLFQVKLVVFRDVERPISPRITEIDTNVQQKST